jgi:sugar fermentation stimulation protein A
MAFHFPFPPLRTGTLVQRYVRFIAEVRLDSGEVVSAHCVNSGRMEGLVRPGLPVWLSDAEKPGRKLRYTWELVDLDGTLVGANTILPNRLVRAALEARAIPGFEDITRLQPERTHGRGAQVHRVDFWMQHADGSEHWLEVKNCHLVYPDGFAYFPDSHSERAAKHARALARLARAGQRATILFTVQRDDARGVRPSAVHDPVFTRALRDAARAGVAMRAFVFEPSPSGLDLRREIPVDLAPYPLPPVRAFAAELAASSGWRMRPKG